MNIKKIRKQLKKINTLFSAIEEEGVANSMERDLMKTYILALYEQFISGDEVDEEKPAPVVQKADKKPKKVVATESIFTEEAEKPVIEKEALESIIEKEYKSVKNGISASATVESVIDLADEEEKEETNVDPIPANNEKYKILFQSEDSNELSSRLSKLPVADLKAAFGLNEKVFNINELFNGDHTTYQSTINTLNELHSIDEAKDFLTKQVIHQYGWLEDHKIKKAANFIKTIQRRYM